MVDPPLDNFEEYLARTFPDDDKRSTSGVIHRKLGQKIKDCLLGNGSFDKNFRCMVKRREYSLLNLPSVGMRDVLVVPAKDEKVQLS